MALNKSEKKLMYNLIVVVHKKDGTIAVSEKRWNTTHTLNTPKAALEYLEDLFKEDKT